MKESHVLGVFISNKFPCFFEVVIVVAVLDLALLS